MSAPRPILIHGSGGGHRVWEPVAARLAGSIALELPGHPDGEPLRDITGIGRAMAAALERVDPPRALVGHSLGGAAALEVARTRPELVEGLVVVASGARLPVPEHAMARARDDFAGERDRLLAGFAGDPAAAGVRAARDAIDACGPDVLLADYAACRSVDLRGRLGGVRVPALVVAGGDDPLTPPWMSEELARELPQAHMVVIPGARHLPMADAPATLAGLVAAYLARLELTLMDP
jgi:pimeloyl-ACP methyl ester carboxylesterase